MSNQWPLVSLGEVVKHRKEFIVVDDLKEYKRCRVQSYAKGVVERDTIPGSLIKTKKQQVCRTGEFLVAEIDAKVGGYGIVPEELDKAIVSSHYFLFGVNEDKLNRRFLDCFIRTPFFSDQVTAQGSTNYAAIRPSHVLNYKIPLPPLNEQKRIVAKVDELATKIEEAKGLRDNSGKEIQFVIESLLKNIISKNQPNKSWAFDTLDKFAEVNPSRRNKLNLQPNDKVTFVPMAAVDAETGTISQPQIRNYFEVAKGFTWFTEGDVIFARITPCMENGKAALANGLINQTGFGSTEFHVLRPGPQITEKWLHCIVRQNNFREDAASHFKGTAGQQRVPESFFFQKQIAVPPLDEQQQIVKYLDELQTKIDSLKKLQAETEKELNALLPSILDKAFKGEL